MSSETVRPGVTGNEYKLGDSREGTSLSVTSEVSLSVDRCWQEGGHGTLGASEVLYVNPFESRCVVI